MTDHDGPDDQINDTPAWVSKSVDDVAAPHRIRAAAMLDDIARQVREALRAENIGMVVFFMIPNSGQAILGFGRTPGDPPDEEWERVGRIVKSVLAELVGLRGTRRQEMRCATTQDQESHDAAA